MPILGRPPVSLPVRARSVRSGNSQLARAKIDPSLVQSPNPSTKSQGLDTRSHHSNMTIETTYFVGAGASKAFYPELPLANEMTLKYLLDRRGSPMGFDQAIEN